jgi:ABC-type glycerol-3-phosphate transport system permease component
VTRRISIGVLALLFCALAVVPFLYVLSTSLKVRSALFEFPPDWIPDEPSLLNYERLITDHPFVRWTLNTLLISSVVAAVKALIDSMAGYALAKLEFSGKRVVSAALLLTVMIPAAVLIIPLYFMMRDLRILDTYWALLLPPLANPIGVLMMRSFIAGLPRDLEHAAALDGAPAFKVYWHVVLPLVRPGLVVVGIYTFLLQYTNFVLPLIGTDSDELMVLTTGLATLQNPADPDYGLLSAGSIAAMVPITAVFVLLQRHFASASFAGALKG